MKYISIFSTVILLLHLNCTPKNLKPLPNLKNYANTTLTSTIDKTYSFPQDWLGYWTGNLNIYDSTGLKNQIVMALDISKTDTLGLYNWTIIYGVDSTAQRREYQLKEINSKVGHYLIDEKNGIYLDAYHIQNELNSIFEVLDKTLIISYALEDEGILFSVKVFPSKEIRVSGNINDDIPKVSSYKLKSTQFAKLSNNAFSNSSSNKPK